jgi:hypothetical protein
LLSLFGSSKWLGLQVCTTLAEESIFLHTPLITILPEPKHWDQGLKIPSLWAVFRSQIWEFLARSMFKYFFTIYFRVVTIFKISLFELQSLVYLPKASYHFLLYFLFAFGNFNYHFPLEDILVANLNIHVHFH